MKEKSLSIITFIFAFFLALSLKLPAQASGMEIFAPVFDSTYYAEANPDLKAIYGTNEALLFQHFITSGMAEGRQGSAEFDVHIYQANNPDLKAVFGENLSYYYLHYINAGKAEGRVASGAPSATATPVTPAASVAAIYNPSNSLATSPMAPRAAEDLAAYRRYRTYTYTGSNGYQIMVKFDPYDLSKYSGDRLSSRWARHNPDNIIYDKTMSYRPEPGNAFLWAYVDFLEDSTQGGTPAAQHFFRTSAGIPMVEMPATKLTRATSTPSFEAFRQAFRNAWGESLYNYTYTQYTYKTPRRTGPQYKTPAELDRWLSLNIYNSGKVVGLNGTALNKLQDYASIRFGLEYSDVYNCWSIFVKYSGHNPPTELLWFGVRNLIRLVTPDAEVIYPQFYEHFYGGNHVFPNYNTWVTVGNSQVMVGAPVNHGTDPYGKVICYYFK